MGLMEAVVERGNLRLAYQRVVENKGAAGVDQLAVSGLNEPVPVGRTPRSENRYPWTAGSVGYDEPERSSVDNGGLLTALLPSLVEKLGYATGARTQPAKCFLTKNVFSRCCSSQCTR